MISKLALFLLVQLFCALMIAEEVESKQGEGSTSNGEADPLGPMSGIITGIFMGADVNRDNVLDEPEFWSTFTNFDLNGDNTISRREYVSVLKASDSPFIAMIGSRRLVTRYARRMFRSGDMDKDGVMSRDDATAIFHNLDNNEDGRVSVAEYRARWVKVLRRIGLISRSQ